MPRRRLTEAEREAKRRATWTDSAYQHYDTRDGYGSAYEWMQAAEALTGNLGGLKRDTSGLSRQNRDDLAIFGLYDLPADVSGLRSAFRKRAFEVHPDHGGSDEAFKAVYAAFERLAALYGAKV